MADQRNRRITMSADSEALSRYVHAMSRNNLCLLTRFGKIVRLTQRQCDHLRVCSVQILFVSVVDTAAFEAGLQFRVGA